MYSIAAFSSSSEQSAQVPLGGMALMPLMAVAVKPSSVAVMVAVPAPTPNATPSMTNATDSSEALHVTSPVQSLVEPPGEVD